MDLVTLLIAWVAVFGLRIVVGGNATAFDEVALWALRILAVLIAMQIAISSTRFIRSLVKARRQGERVLTEASVRTMLLGLLVAGLVCRVSTWGSGRQGVVGWTGAVLIGMAIIGLGVLYLRQARKTHETVWSWRSPYVRAALVFLFIASLIALGAAQPTGVFGGLLVAVFWLSLLALLIHIVGGRFRRPNHHLG